MTLEDSLQVRRDAEAATARILRITRELLDNRARGVTVAHPDGARLVSAESYRSVDVVEAERAHLFRRLPLAVATSADLREVGSYITRDLAGVPTLVTRGSDGLVRAFLNSCVHRGIEVAQGDGTVRGRFVCRYHGWSYDDRGTLVAVAQADTVGDVDVGCRGLREFQCEERHGLVFVQVDTGAPMDLSAHLGAFEPVIESMGLQDMVCAAKRQLHHEVNPDHVDWAEAHVERVFGTLEHEDYDTIVEAQRAIDSGLVDDLMLAANEQMLIDMTRAWSRGIGAEPSDVAVVADG